MKQNLGANGAGSCPQNTFCLWNNSNFEQGGTTTTKIRSLVAWGTVSDMGKLGPRSEGSGFYPTMQDVVSSMVNNTPGTLCFYSDNNFSGAVFQIHGWEKWPNLPSWIDNKISSFRFC
ncbi:peptidase inhibitor family I36 protein [Actinoplanes sp. CA-054009]